MADNIVKRLLDAGVQVTEMSQARAEQLVKDLVSMGGLRRKEAERTVNELIARGRSSTESFVTVVQREVSTQVGRLIDRLDEVESVLGDVASRLGVNAPSVRRPGKKSAPKKAATKKTATKKTATKKAATKKAATKKAATKKAGTKKAATKKAATKKAAPKKAATKTAAAKKATAKKAASRR